MVNLRKYYFDILDKETELQVLGEAEDDWLLVYLNGEIGFVKKDYTISILDKIIVTLSL